MQEGKSTNVHFADALNRLMRAKNIDNASLARAVGVTPTAVGNYLDGRLPRSEHLMAIAQYFGVKMETLLSFQSQSQSQQFSRLMESTPEGITRRDLEEFRSAMNTAIDRLLKKI
jgi:transcriptional regulator with XRE-family HTH domain